MNHIMARTEYLGVHVGDTIEIIRLDDPYTPESYVGKQGVVEHIDDAGQLHGTWGGLAVIPGVDGVKIVKRANAA